MAETFEVQFPILKTKFYNLGAQVKKIHAHGQGMSLDNVDHKNTFRGMFMEISSIFSSFKILNDQLTDLCITHNQKSHFPTEEDKKFIDVIRVQYYNILGKGESLWPSQPTGLSVADLGSAIREAATAAAMATVGAGSSSVRDDRGNTGFVTTATASSRIRRPKISLPNFNGQTLSDWPLFRDTFEALIHDEDIPVIEKYHCLLSALSGSALALIKHIRVCEDNYEQAWSLLNKYFNNKRKLASSYINKLLTFRPTTDKCQTASLKSFLLNVLENISAFNNLTIPNRAEYLLFELAIRNLDPETRRAFEIENSSEDFPSFETLKSFVEKRYLALTMINETKSDPTFKFDFKNNSTPSSSNKYFPKMSKGHTSTILMSSSKLKNSPKQIKESRPPPFITNTNSSLPTCFVCGGTHTLKYCNTFYSMSPAERLNLLKQWKGCKNCLHPSHSTSQCSSAYTCRECKNRHHTLLHVPLTTGSDVNKQKTTSLNTTLNIKPVTSVGEQAPPPHSTTLTAMNHTCDALLGTVQAFIKDNRGHFHKIRLVIDSGSQFSLITQDFVHKLGLPINEFTRLIKGIGSGPAFHTRGKVRCTFRSSAHNQPEFNSEAVVVPAITNQLPQTVLPNYLRRRFTDFDLADPYFWKPGPIDYLLGADHFCDIISGLPIALSPDEPKLLKTIFGYIIIGKVPSSISLQAIADVSLGVTSCNEQLEQIMDKFWEMEEVKVPVPQLSPDEQKCEEHFLATHYRLSSGRYGVSYPFKQSPSPNDFEGSKRQALNRLFNLEQKFRKNPSLRKDYNTFMEEYVNLGHMRLASNLGEYYIPHHPVFKIECGKPKIRVVFDASSRTKCGSLNDHLLTGPKLQNDISAIILRFRRHPVVFTCDIVKMYRQILINPNDCKYQHIVWRFSEEEPVEDWELLTVTYGTAPAPYQSLRTLEQLVRDEGNKFPLAVDVIRHDRYIDDLCSGASTFEETIELRRQVIGLLNAGGFTLSKWTSNVPSILSDVSFSSTPVSLVDHDQSIKILGLQWDPQHDHFSYNFTCPEALFTKRAILSAIGKLYDPLGYLSPVTFFAKVILQETWKSALGWDDLVPDNLKRNWMEFLDDIPNLVSIKIPRYLESTPRSPSDVIGFCDASSKGFCASIYLRIHHHNPKIYLLKSKTRLAPIKTLTIPRLELNAALLLAQLYTSIKELLDHYNPQRVLLFTDAEIVLGWLKTPPYRLKTYIANRVVRILELVNVNWWHYISTNENPADCGSRGCLPSQLSNHSLWWSGPSWINQPFEYWPTSYDIVPFNDLPEIKAEVTTLISVTFQQDFVLFTERFSSFIRLVNVVSYVLRFTSNSLTRSENRLTGPITTHEFRTANNKIIWCLQQYYYPEAFGENPKWSQFLSSLAAFKDDKGLLRVGGRICKSNLSYNAKHPILLPRRSHFTNLVVDYYHRIHLHIGPAALHAIINQAYWIPAAKSLIKQRKRLCIVCIKFSKHQLAPRMGDLPSSRFTEVRAFYKSGVDFAGPFWVRESNRRKAPLTKAYLSLFVCLSTKALHLELVSSLSTEAFLDAFERFVSRRGLPSQMISDRGSNFIGASNFLREVNDWIGQTATRSKIVNHGTQRGILWSFNSPASPHLGGIYEAGIKSVKSLLVKTLGAQPYLLSELGTMFTKIEAVLNSRPLYSLSTDPSDLQPLTPGHFLIGGPLTSLPEIDLIDVPPNRLSRWQHLRNSVQVFWNRWRHEYLATLQRRNKWLQNKENLRVGTLVFVTDLKLPPYKWPLARIIDVHPGEDGIVRVATVKTSTGIYKRPVVKLLSLQLITEPANDEANHSSPSPSFDP